MADGQGGLYMVPLTLSSEATVPGPTVGLRLVVSEPTGQVYGEGELTQAVGGGVGFGIRRITGTIISTGMGTNISLVALQGDYIVPAGAAQSAQAVGIINLALVVDAQWNGCASFTYGTHGEISCPRAEVQSQQS
jgi:Domain of unknown function (DUF1842)